MCFETQTYLELYSNAAGNRCVFKRQHKTSKLRKNILKVRVLSIETCSVALRFLTVGADRHVLQIRSCRVTEYADSVAVLQDTKEAS